MDYQFLTRGSIALLYIWFGALKLFGASPATSLVTELSNKLLPFIPADTFMLILGLVEVGLGCLFLVPRLTNFATVSFGLHIATTFLPLILLPHLTWSAAFVPTLEGQYIIKNLALIVVVWGIFLNRRSKAKLEGLQVASPQ